jgi:hypothetical protein
MITVIAIVDEQILDVTLSHDLFSLFCVPYLIVLLQWSPSGGIPEKEEKQNPHNRFFQVARQFLS